ncbi:hypothetical protein JCM10207_003378 [Rhodosporidiobolus poonsookiae]
MLSSLLFSICYLALAANPSAVYALPIPPSSGIVPLQYGAFNPQKPFARPSPPAKLRFAADDDSDSDAVDALTAFGDFVNPDTIYADSIQPGGVEASLAAVLASRQRPATGKVTETVRRAQVAATEKRFAKRDWVVPGRPTALAASTSPEPSSPSSTLSSSGASSTEASTPTDLPVSMTTTTTRSKRINTHTRPASSASTESATPSSTPSAVQWFHAPEASDAPTLGLRPASFGSLGSLSA